MSDDLDALFRLYGPELTRLARNGLGNREAAADAVQEVFARYAALDGRTRTGETIGAARAFLHRMLRNRIIDTQRQALRHGAGAPSETVPDLLADPAPGPFRQALSAEAATALRAALAAMPARPREVFILHRFHGLGYAEIATRLGIARNTVEIHMARALALLRDRLRDFADTPLP
ncbi:RNA polymerase sigma factor [Rhodovastum atsumiense]|uniref:RNA polymerase sigma factor n=1 Tax=Rhodovastum atsumiense TaxID=504468 RepID=A0A5M6IRK4_9PROT|nr:RNA polymerase sigma factor [Rhodovastum atsumiense]KAA5610940.1 RNA polymerase sigma factor [Rhodovastum atsumiense]CAH2601487.1 RNA polymerase sigma factor [Rhodovastum atsumiense]